MKYLVFLLSAFVYATEIDSFLIRGTEAKEGMFPQIVAIKSDGAGCSATLVGPQVLMTAAHCAYNNAKVTTVIDGEKYSGVAKRHPSYPRTDIDIAAVKLSKEVPDITPIHVHEDQVQVKDEITLTGYGCTQPGGDDGEFGTLRYGTAVVTGRSNYDLVSTNGAALCYGDSGSGVLKDNQIVAVNSKGNISTRNLTLELYKVKAWLLKYATDNEVEICGITPRC